MSRLVLVVAVLFTTPVLAQQQPSPAQTALAVNQAVSQIALALESAQRQVAALQAENAALKTKCGDPCAAPQK